MDSYRIKRKNALPLSAALREYLSESRLAPGLNSRRIFAAWDAVSGAAPQTLKRFYRGGKLYITLNSSVARSRLGADKELLKQRINDFLSQDDFFIRDEGGSSWVEELILK